MQHQTLRDLLRRYANGTCTREERKQVEDMVLRKPVTGDWDWNSDEERILMGIVIKQRIDTRRFTKNRAIKKWAYISAASILVAFGLTLIWLYTADSEENRDQLVINESVFAPDQGVTLTLADGSTVRLDDSTGQLGTRGELTHWTFEDGQLVYGGDSEESASAYHTIQTPNGKQFHIVLPDGTKVWLNTASSLIYPVAFGGRERRVTLVGEAYFEVAPDKSKPFIVGVQDTEVIVTGTHFNISAYTADKSVTTTLLEGGVDIWSGDQKVSLVPGYQAVSYNDGRAIDKRVGNLDQTLAWKNGYFMFNDMDVVSVMRSVARWYDIQVMIAGDIPPTRFGGTFPITADLKELLLDLESLGDVTLKQKGKEVWIVW